MTRKLNRSHGIEVGSQVLVLSSEGSRSFSESVGKVLTVSEIVMYESDGGCDLIKCVGIGGSGQHPHRFQLVKADTITTIADLTTGMRVITNDGRAAIFVEEAEHSVAAIVYAGESCWDRAFLSTDGYRCHIKEVYAAPKHAASYLNVSARGELLWSAVDAAKREALEAAKAKLAAAQAEVEAAEAALK
jgi:hypothetical protein